MNRWLCLLAVVSLALGAMACGGDSDGSDAGTSSGGTSGGTGGTTGATGGTSSTTTGTPDGGATTTAGTGAMAMCDTSIPTTATCGSTSCPAASGLMACQVPCCATGDVCGFRNATMGAVTDCQASPEEDPECPDYTGMATLQGCCYDGTTCGFISTFSNTCIITSMFLADLASMAGAACDGSDNDGGI